MKRLYTILIAAAAGLFMLSNAAAYMNDRYGRAGLASWYGGEYRGRETASGERFDPEDLTAAHRALALGSVVEVRHMASGRSVRVRINDRGPFISGRIIDLSAAAARRLGMLDEGVAKVEIDVIREGKG